jgi:murein tripeptide amidase MpaA
LQARQHAWESGASWVCRGLAEWLAGDDPRARHLREKCEIYIVPIMDIDNTATGNGGKEALPQDHNRDWTDQPHHAEVAAAQKHLRRLSEQGRLALFVDLHNPGPSDKQPFFYVCPDETLVKVGRRNLDRWLTVCRAERAARSR